MSAIVNFNQNEGLIVIASGLFNPVKTVNNLLREHHQ